MLGSLHPSSRALLAVFALAAAVCAEESLAAGGGNPRVHIRNVHLMVNPEVTLEVRELYGRLVPLRKGQIPVFDDPRSFGIEISHATAAFSTASMTALLNGYTFAYPGAPLRQLQVEARDGKLWQKGILHKGVDVPFEMEGELSVRPDGLLKVHPTSIKVAGIVSKRLLDALGIELMNVIKVRHDRGVAIDGDDLLLDPNRLLPPPKISGKLGAVHIEGDRIVLEFVGAGPSKGLDPSAGVRNYMYFKGGQLRFGKLTMRDTDLVIADADSQDPFRFYLAQYRRQLVAGYSKTMPDLGLVSFMPDADKVDHPLKDSPTDGQR
jgi:hypothetical protein